MCLYTFTLQDIPSQNKNIFEIYFGAKGGGFEPLAVIVYTLVVNFSSGK